MPTTTIRLSEELKERISIAAEKAGSSTHAFILEAVAEKAEQVERMEAFHDEAHRRYENLAESGKTIPWEAMRGYLIQRASGKNPRRPRPRKLVR